MALVSPEDFSEENFGFVTSIPLPDGSQLGLYQPKHPLARLWLEERGAKKNRRRPG